MWKTLKFIDTGLKRLKFSFFPFFPMGKKPWKRFSRFWNVSFSKVWEPGIGWFLGWCQENKMFEMWYDRSPLWFPRRKQTWSRWSQLEGSRRGNPQKAHRPAKLALSEEFAEEGLGYQAQRSPGPFCFPLSVPGIPELLLGPKHTHVPSFKNKDSGPSLLLTSIWISGCLQQSQRFHRRSFLSAKCLTFRNVYWISS